MKIATWNILAQGYIKPERYRGIDPRALLAGPRRALLLRRLKALDADALLLQEVSPSAFVAITDALPQFEGRYAPRRNGVDAIEALYAGIPCTTTFSTFRHHQGLAWVRWKQGQAEALDHARAAEAAAGDGGHLRLRVLALRLQAHILGPGEAADALQARIDQITGRTSTA